MESRIDKHLGICFIKHQVTYHVGALWGSKSVNKQVVNQISRGLQAADRRGWEKSASGGLGGCWHF